MHICTLINLCNKRHTFSWAHACMSPRLYEPTLVRAHACMSPCLYGLIRIYTSFWRRWTSWGICLFYCRCLLFSWTHHTICDATSNQSIVYSLVDLWVSRLSLWIYLQAATCILITFLVVKPSHPNIFVTLYKRSILLFSVFVFVLFFTSNEHYVGEPMDFLNQKTVRLFSLKYMKVDI